MRFPRYLIALLAVFTLAACEEPITQPDITPQFASEECETCTGNEDWTEIASRFTQASDHMEAAYGYALAAENNFNNWDANVDAMLGSARYYFWASYLEWDNAAAFAAAQDRDNSLIAAEAAAQWASVALAQVANANYRVRQGWAGNYGWSSTYANSYNANTATPKAVTAHGHIGAAHNWSFQNIWPEIRIDPYDAGTDALSGAFLQNLTDGVVKSATNIINSQPSGSTNYPGIALDESTDALHFAREGFLDIGYGLRAYGFTW